MQATSKGSDQTASIPRLVKHLLVAQITTLFEISCRGSIIGMCVFMVIIVFFLIYPHVLFKMTSPRIASTVLRWRQSHASEPVHEISNNVVCVTSKASDQPAHMRSLIRDFASRLSVL